MVPTGNTGRIDNAGRNDWLYIRMQVLIHCQMGMSRSSTLVILWLMHKHGMNLREATAFTRAKRPFINPNPGFMQQLGEWEEAKFGP